MAVSALTSSSLLADDGYGSITTQFNSGNLVNNNYLWFTGVVKPASFPAASPLLVLFTGGKITIGATELSIPDAQVIFDPSIPTGSTSFNTALNRWETVAPWNFSDKVFLTGYAYKLPNDLPGGMDVTFSGNFDANVQKEQLQWQWAAAEYSLFNFNPDYNTYLVKPLHSTTLDSYPYPHQAGTAENYSVPGFLVTGGTGDAGNNFTGYYTAPQTVTTTPEPSTLLAAFGILSVSSFAFRRRYRA